MWRRRGERRFRVYKEAPGFHPGPDYLAIDVMGNLDSFLPQSHIHCQTCR
jgi:hypothetical protein